MCRRDSDGVGEATVKPHCFHGQPNNRSALPHIGWDAKSLKDGPKMTINAQPITTQKSATDDASFAARNRLFGYLQLGCLCTRAKKLLVRLDEVEAALAEIAGPPFVNSCGKDLSRVDSALRTTRKELVRTLRTELKRAWDLTTLLRD
jgi:hypothetical protein